MIPTDRNRLRYEAFLTPAMGSTFQPTGFPDIGAARFERFDDEGQVQNCLLVESVQSMANRLEATAWDAGAQQPVPLFAQLPYIRVYDQKEPDKYLTSSRQEAHRLASAFVRNSTLDGESTLEVIRERFGLAKDTPLNYPRMAVALLQLDPFCLIHGAFFSDAKWIGQPRFPRAVSAVIEAYDVRPAISGGLKSERVSLQSGEGGSGEGYGPVPFHRTEWTARQLKAQFSVDVELLRSYGLGEEITELLTAIALWEVRSFLDGGLRLRTACDLDLDKAPDSLPELSDLATRIEELLSVQAEAFGASGPRSVLWGKK